MDENELAELLVETRQKIRTANHAKCQLYSNIYQSICLRRIFYTIIDRQKILEISWRNTSYMAMVIRKDLLP